MNSYRHRQGRSWATIFHLAGSDVQFATERLDCLLPMGYVGKRRKFHLSLF